MKLIRAILLLLAQFAGMLVLSYGLCNTVWLSRALYNACIWALLPLAGAVSAYMVTVRGVNNYIAWIAPPLSMLAGHLLAFFYMPASAGPFFVSILLAIIGAATGDVALRFRQKK